MGFVVPPTAASAQRRVALVIGNAAYDAPSARLINPVNDAQAMSAMLQDLDFEVTEVTDANQEQMDDGAAQPIGRQLQACGLGRLRIHRRAAVAHRSAVPVERRHPARADGRAGA